MSLIRRVFALIAAATFALALAGCVNTGDNGSSGKSDSEKPVYNDPNATPNLKLPKNPRVVALGWSDGEIALSMGVKPTAIYDWMSFGDKNKGVGPWASAKFGNDTPKVISAQSGGNFNYQQIKELKPDLILNVRSKSDSKTLTNLRKIAPVVAAPNGSPDYGVNWKTQTQLIGKALDKGSDADKLVAQTTSLQQNIRRENPEFEGKKFVWGAKFGEAYGAYVKGDARFDTFADLGFVANPALQGLQSAGFFAQVPAEKVKSLDGQVAIFTTIGKSFADLKNDKALNSLDVVKDGRAVLLDETDPSVMAMSAGTPESLSFALKNLAPKLSAAAKK